jgi:hypothetical protein
MLVRCGCAYEDRPDKTGGGYFLCPVNAGSQEVAREYVEHDQGSSDNDGSTGNDKLKVG